nr:hypothetical protein [Tanacetum cinerariifolium]
HNSYNIDVGHQERMVNICIHYGGRIVTDQMYPRFLLRLDMLYYRVPGKIAVLSVDNALKKLERANDLQFLLSPDSNEELIYMYFKPYAIYLDDCFDR